ncbi:hypothetical protein Goe5_c01040 [Bacillus phage vB_BthM-Goe5]|nr:hypothetical protein Goe5_c01040 [Bacillus phage vB_BthM-Goe5]
MREKHGMTGSRLYNIYRNMNQRCHNPKNTSFNKYGDKGIEVCTEWRNSPTAFMDWALDNGYSDKLTIDRVDPLDGYHPSNCRWIPLEENSRRASAGRKLVKGGKTPKLVNYNGKSQSMRDWADEFGIPYKTLHQRVRRHNGVIEEAFSILNKKERR